MVCRNLAGGGGEPTVAEWRILRPDGQRVEALISAACVSLSDGSDYQVMSAVDLGDRRRLEDEARALRDHCEASTIAKSQFLANMSHELRTPLNAIIGFSEIIRDEVLGPVGTAQYSEYADDIHRSGQLLLELVDDVLDTARIEAGKLEISDKAIDVQWLLADIHRLLAERANGAGVRLIVDIPLAPPHLRGDERRLRQMLLNIVSNGIKFAESGGVVMLDAVNLSGGRFAFRIRDSGSGIRLEELPLLMEAFRHSSSNDPSLARNQGAGMGLPLAKAIVEAHGGSLLIDRVDMQGKPGVPPQMTEITALLPPERVMALSHVVAQGGAAAVSFDVFAPGGRCIPAHIETMSEEEFQQLAIGVLLLDRHGRILRCNSLECAFRGHNAEEMIGRDYFREIAPETRTPDFHDCFKQGMTGGTLDADFEFMFDLPTRPAKAWVRMQMADRPNSAWVFTRWI